MNSTSPKSVNFSLNQQLAKPTTGPEGVPVRIIEIHNNSIQVDHKELESILLQPEINNLPIALVTVMGQSNHGKSFLLNYMLRFLNNTSSGNDGGSSGGSNWMKDNDINKPLVGFPWNNNAMKHNKNDSVGLDIWSKPFIIQNNRSQDIAVFLLDFSNSEAINKLYEFVLSICSTVVFLQMDEINTESIDKLFKSYKLLKDINCSILNQVYFLISNWTPSDVHDVKKIKYGSNEGQIQLDKIINNKIKSLSLKDKAMKLEFETMIGYFDELACHLLPKLQPSSGTELFDGRFAQLNKEFIKSYKEFITTVLEESLISKHEFSGKEMTCSSSSILDTIQNSMRMMNQLYNSGDRRKTSNEPNFNNSVSSSSSPSLYKQINVSTHPKVVLSPGTHLIKSKLKNEENDVEQLTNSGTMRERVTRNIQFNQVVEESKTSCNASKTQTVENTVSSSNITSGDKIIEKEERGHIGGYSEMKTQQQQSTSKVDIVAQSIEVDESRCCKTPAENIIHETITIDDDDDDDEDMMPSVNEMSSSATNSSNLYQVDKQIHPSASAQHSLSSPKLNKNPNEKKSSCDFDHEDKDYKIVKQVQNQVMELYKEFIEENFFNNDSQTEAMETNQQPDNNSAIEWALEMFEGYLKQHKVSVTTDHLNVMKVQLINQYGKTKVGYTECMQNKQRNNIIEDLKSSIIDKSCQKLKNIMGTSMNLNELNKCIEVETKSIQFNAVEDIRRVYKPEPVEDETLIQEFSNKLESELQTLSNEYQISLSILCNINFVDLIEKFKVIFLNKIQDEFEQLERLFTSNTWESIKNDSFETVLQGEECFSLFSKFPTLTKVQFYNPISKFIDSTKNMVRQLNGFITEMEDSFVSCICFTTTNFEKKMSKVLRTYESKQYDNDLKLKEFTDFCFTFFKNKFTKQNEVIIQHEIEIQRDIEEKIKQFYNQEMKGYVKSSCGCYKSDLQKFHNGLVSSLFEAIKTATGYKQETMNLLHNYERIEQDLNSFLSKYVDNNELNREIVAQKIATFKGKFRMAYKERMASKCAQTSFYNPTELHGIHSTLSMELKKLYSIDIKNLVQNTKGEEGELQIILDFEFKSFEKKNNEKYEAYQQSQWQKEEEARQRQIKADRERKEREAEVEKKRQEQKKQHEIEMANKKKLQKEHEAIQRKQQQENEKRKRKAEIETSNKNISDNQKYPAEVELRKWLPKGTETMTQGHNNPHPSSSYCNPSSPHQQLNLNSNIKIVIDFGLEYIKAGFINPNNNNVLQLIPGQNGQVNIENVICVNERKKEIEIGTRNGDQIIEMKEILLQLKVNNTTKRILILNEKAVDLCFEELIAIILKQIKINAESYLKCSITQNEMAQIIIPMWFTQEQRRGIKIGAQIVGFNNVRLISDLSAVALNYKCTSPATDNYLLVININCNIFCASLFNCRKGSVEMKRFGSNLTCVKTKESKNIIGKVLKYGKELLLGSASSEEMERKQIIKYVIGANICKKIYIIGLHGELQQREIEKLILNDHNNLYGLFEYHNDNFGLNGTARFANERKPDELKEVTVYKLESQTCDGKTRIICDEGNNLNTTRTVFKIYSDLIDIHGKTKFRIYETRFGKQIQLGCFSFEAPEGANSSGKFEFEYSIVADGILSANVRLGTSAVDVQWFGNNLPLSGIGKAIENIQKLKL